MPGGAKSLKQATKKHLKGAFLRIFNKLALLLQFFLSEEIGKQCGA
ncbi:Uncharacterised protein [Escherichia coli]|uniref:Uncharacterized protein n=1 Tax=Escherichia coli TaxID=562 RepID=A0A447X1L5_ECOLX|nr:Uncharacterised protein [Escherichia coli]